MKKIKLGFIAIALLGAATAFATNVTSNGLPECSQANVSTICEPGDEDCCIATEQLKLCRAFPCKLTAKNDNNCRS
ncbi:MAG: hypothetical protein H3C48_09865 [Chitinophagaceae bacterium]|nr:hypothetical protein [Chitinophagaceae bacterium]